jgi:hypothetical protein
VSLKQYRSGCGWAALGLLLLFALGCGQGHGRPHIQGKVTYKNTPLAGQTLALFSAGGAKEFFSQKFPLQADGAFSGTVAAPGEYKVAIEPSLASQEGAKTAGKQLDIPPKYRDPNSSGLTWTIKEGENPRDFDLPE